MVYSFNDPETGQAQALAKARELLEDPATPALMAGQTRKDAGRTDRRNRVYYRNRVFVCL